MFSLRLRWQLVGCIVLALGIVVFLLTRKNTTPQQVSHLPNKGVFVPGPLESTLDTSPSDTKPVPSDSIQPPASDVDKRADPQLVVERVKSFEESLRLRERLRVRALPQWEDTVGTHYPHLISPPTDTEMQEMRALANSAFEDFGAAEQQEMNEARTKLLEEWADFKDNLRYVDIMVPKNDNTSVQVIISDIANEQKLNRISESNPNIILATGRHMEMRTIDNSSVGWRYSHLLHTSPE